MTTLHLGVIDQNYRNESRGYVGKTGKPGKRRTAQVNPRTTFDVAKILESKYHIMESFYEMHAPEVAQKMANAYAGAVETALMRKQMPVDPAAAGLTGVKKQFNDFIDSEELAGIVPGVPTLAALHGVSHRFLHPYAMKNGRRPSFIDTGLYETSFIAWVD